MIKELKSRALEMWSLDDDHTDETILEIVSETALAVINRIDKEFLPDSICVAMFLAELRQEIKDNEL